MARRGRETLASPADRRRCGNTSVEKIRIASVPFLPNRASPANLLNRQSGERGAEAEISPRPAGPGPSTIATNMLERHPTSSSWQQRLHWPASNCARCCCPAWWRPRRATVPPFHCRGRLRRWASAAAPPPGRMAPARPPPSAPSTPSAPHRRHETIRWSWQGKLVQGLGRSALSVALNSEAAFARRRERPPPTTPQIQSLAS